MAGSLGMAADRRWRIARVPFGPGAGWNPADRRYTGGGVVVETADVSVLDEPTAVHDRDVVGHVGYHPKVVGEMRISPMPDSSWSSLSRVMIWA